MSAALERMFSGVRTRIANLISRAVVRRVYDSKGMQTLQVDVLDGETRDQCERFQPYGLSAHPHPGAEAVVLFVGGRRDHPLVVAVEDRRYRPAGLEEGEVALYTDEGDSVRLSRDRIVVITAGAKVQINAPAVEASGTVKATGFRVGSDQVVGARQGSIPLPVGPGVIDADARAAIGLILSALQAHGLIGTPSP